MSDHWTLYTCVDTACASLFWKIYNSTVLCIVEFTGDTIGSARMVAGENGNKAMD